MADSGGEFPEITDETLHRYRRNYSLSPEVPVTVEMVRQHLMLELELTQVLLSSRAQDRREVWVQSYDRLYSELPWLAVSAVRSGHKLDLEYGHFLQLIPPGARVIDIGSGVGYLATYLSENGRPCVATEITRERGLRADGLVTWHETDGIHLSAFETKASYDFVTSTQVIEHLHPEDVEEHFRGASDLLRPGGRYIFNTPHAFLGPQDFSRVLKLDRPRFMHLKEYTHKELGEIARSVGFKKISAIYIPPSAVRAYLPIVVVSSVLQAYLVSMEGVLGNRRLPPFVLRALLFSGDVFMAVTK